MMVVHRRWERFSAPLGLKLPAALAVPITFAGVNVGWALFCMDLPRALLALGRIAGVR